MPHNKKSQYISAAAKLMTLKTSVWPARQLEREIQTKDKEIQTKD